MLNQASGKTDATGSVDMAPTAAIPSSSKQIVEPGSKTAPSNGQLDYGY